MKYLIILERIAESDLKKIYKSGNKIDINKIEKMLEELEVHPKKVLENQNNLNTT